MEVDMVDEVDEVDKGQDSEDRRQKSVGGDRERTVLKAVLALL